MKKPLLYCLILMRNSIVEQQCLKTVSYKFSVCYCRTHQIMRALRNILMCLFASLAIVNAAGKYYEEISATDGTTIIEYPLQRTPIIHKSFHKCSISKYCTYVIKNLASGKFSLCNSRADLPHNTTGLRIWKKIDHGKTKLNS